MTRRYFLAALGALIVKDASAQGYVDPPGYHRHQCTKATCGTIWQHATNANGSHNCYNCGSYQNVWYQGPLGPTRRVLVPQVVVVQQSPPIANPPVKKQPAAENPFPKQQLQLTYGH